MRTASAVGVLFCAVLGAAVTPASPAVAVGRSTTYWVAGWLPTGEHLQRATTIEGERNQAPGGVPPGTVNSFVEYGLRSGGSGSADFQITAVATDAVSRTPQCQGGTRRIVRGHRALECVDTDEGNPFATLVVWQESAHLTITVEGFWQHTPAMSAAATRRVAASVRRVDAAAWKRLVTETTGIVKPIPGMQHKTVAAGLVDGDRWTLTALIPPGFPLGPDDRRGPCARLTFRGHGKTACRDDGPSSQFARLGGKVFVLGMVPTTVRRVSLHDLDYATYGTGAPTVEIATASTYPARPAQKRFFAALLPDGNCGVYVFDADHPTSSVGFAPGRPFDTVCSGQPSPALPPPGRPPATSR